MQGNYKQAFEASVDKCEIWYEIQPKISMTTLTLSTGMLPFVSQMVKKKIELISPKKMPKSTQKFLMKGHKKDE